MKTQSPNRSFLYDPIHPMQLRDAMEKADAALEIFYRDVATIPAEHLIGNLEDLMNVVGLQTFEAGREWARSFMNLEKMAWIPDSWNWGTDVKKMLAKMKVSPTQYVMDELHDALAEGSGPPVEKLSQKLGYEQGKNAARTVIMNLYAKSALRQWDEDGIKYVKRIAFEDNKTCPVCRGLNGTEYLIKDLLELDDPQSNATHFSCRCNFLPIMNISTYAPKKRELPDLDINVNGNSATNVPVELYGLLKSLMLKTKLPFDIEFDNKIKEDYLRDKNKLIINPRTLADEDVRELIFSEEAEALWKLPLVQKRVTEEYLPLIKGGFAKTTKSYDTDKELFVANWIAYRLGQAPMNTDIWSQSFFESFNM
jgi:SPP1 gp7 family putative phage head morphogenesis protein